MRVITFVDIGLIIKDSTNVFLLSIYDKSETENISANELKRLIDSVKKI